MCRGGFHARPHSRRSGRGEFHACPHNRRRGRGRFHTCPDNRKSGEGESMNKWRKLKVANAPLEIIDGDRGKNYPSQDQFKNDGHCFF